VIGVVSYSLQNIFFFRPIRRVFTIFELFKNTSKGFSCHFIAHIENQSMITEFAVSWAGSAGKKLASSKKLSIKKLRRALLLTKTFYLCNGVENSYNLIVLWNQDSKIRDEPGVPALFIETICHFMVQKNETKNESPFHGTISCSRKLKETLRSRKEGWCLLDIHLKENTEED